jgi:cytochrome c oxidase cbb3-type subunit 3
MNDSTSKIPGENEVIHEVDGIREYDNRLPNWWLYTLFGTIVFAFFYWFHYHVFETGETPRKEYKREMAALMEKQGKSVPMTAEALMDLSKDGKTVSDGATVFSTTCAACHAATGGGNIGPNLTDEYWLHGGAPEQIFASIRDGYPQKGMPAWGPQLGDKRVQAVTAYVLTLRNTNVPGGKPPQGEKYATR